MVRNFLKNLTGSGSDASKSGKKSLDIGKAAANGQLTYTIPDVIKELRLELSKRLKYNVPLMTVINPLCDEIYNKCYGYPASRTHHHADPRIGLIEHSFGTAIQILNHLSNADPTVQLHAVMAALGHDLGKVTEHVTDTQRYRYNPFTHSFLLDSNKYIPTLVCKRPGFGPEESAKISPALLAKFMPDAYYSSSFFSAIDYAQVIDAIVRHHEPVSLTEPNFYLRALKQADNDDCALSEEAIERDAVDTEHDSQMLEIVKKAIRSRIGKGALATATYGKHYAYVQEDDVVYIAFAPLMFFQSSTSGVSVTELLVKDGHNVTQSGITNLLLRNGMTTRKGLLEFQGKKGEIFDYYFLPANSIINPVPKNGTASAYRDFIEVDDTPEAILIDSEDMDNHLAGTTLFNRGKAASDDDVVVLDLGVDAGKTSKSGKKGKQAGNSKAKPFGERENQGKDAGAFTVNTGTDGGWEEDVLEDC